MKRRLTIFLGLLALTVHAFGSSSALLHGAPINGLSSSISWRMCSGLIERPPQQHEQDLIDSLKGHRDPPTAEGILRVLDQGPKLYASSQFQKLNELLDAAAVLHPDPEDALRLLEYYLMLDSDASARKLLKWLKEEYGSSYEYGLCETILDVNSNRKASMDWEGARFLLENWMSHVAPHDLEQMLPQGHGPSATKATAYLLLGALDFNGNHVPMFSNFALRQALAADPLNPIISYALAGQISYDYLDQPKLRKTKLREAISILRAALPRVRGNDFKTAYLSLLNMYEREIR